MLIKPLSCFVLTLVKLSSCKLILLREAWRQADDGQADHPIVYFSRKLLPQKQRYYTISIMNGYKSWNSGISNYLIGRPFMIQTDHLSLEWLDRIRYNNTSVALSPWQVFLVC